MTLRDPAVDGIASRAAIDEQDVRVAAVVFDGVLFHGTSGKGTTTKLRTERAGHKIGFATWGNTQRAGASKVTSGVVVRSITRAAKAAAKTPSVTAYSIARDTS